MKWSTASAGDPYARRCRRLPKTIPTTCYALRPKYVSLRKRSSRCCCRKASGSAVRRRLYVRSGLDERDRLKLERNQSPEIGDLANRSDDFSRGYIAGTTKVVTTIRQQYQNIFIR